MRADPIRYGGIVQQPGSSVAKYADLATQFGYPINGPIAITSRGMGFLARPFLPDGIPNTRTGRSRNRSISGARFNNGLQLTLVKQAGPHPDRRNAAERRSV